MLVPAHLTATTFLKQLSSGRTRPCVFDCVDQDGAPAGEYVVKLRANMTVPDSESMFEMVGALLAHELGLTVPAPAFVEIDPALATFIDPAVRGPVSASSGINFGSEYKTGGYVAWQPERRVPERLVDRAFDVFAFDALIDNPDRQKTNPNLLENGEEIVVIDHESAFSFVYALGQDPAPWDLTRAEHLLKHVFYQDLCRLLPELDRIKGAIGAFTQQSWTELEGILPITWKSPPCDKVHDHLLGVTGHLDLFITAIKGRLQ